MRRFAALTLAALLAGAPLVAAEADDIVAVRLIDGGRTPEGVHMAAVEIRLAPGWHTYWRAPGMNGVPPLFDWSGSGNLAAVAQEWPRPVVFESFGLPTIGYKDTVVLPVLLTPAAADAPIEARLEFSYGVCRDICIPKAARLAAVLEAGPGGASAGDRAAIESALARRPLDGAAAGVAAARCSLDAEGAGYRILAEVDFAAAPPGDVLAVIEAEDRPDLWISDAETSVAGRSLRASARIDALGPGALAVDRSALRLTLLSPDRAIDIRGCPAR